jgi:Recombinase zinc beta ribbon domain
LRCGECGRSITAEVKIKRQKNGNVHHYTYYRCTKKDIKCSQPHIRAEELERQLSSALKTFVMPPEWARGLSAMADKDEKEGFKATTALTEDLRSKMIEIDRKQDRLLEGYISELIEPDRYREEKNKLTSEKKTLAEQMTRLEQKGNNWLEPLRNWIKDAQTLNKIDETTLGPLKKSFAKKIFGSNLFLKNQKIEFITKTQYAELSSAYRNNGNAPSCNIVAPGVGITRRAAECDASLPWVAEK